MLGQVLSRKPLVKRRCVNTTQTNVFNKMKGIVRTSVIFLPILSALAWAETPENKCEHLENIHYFDLPLQDLSEALLELGSQSNLSLVIDPEKTKKYRSSPVVGRMKSSDALVAVLDKTPLAYRCSSDTGLVTFIAHKKQKGIPFNKAELLRELGVEEVLVTATGTARPLDSVPAIASIITSKQIRVNGFTSINQALEMVPGFHVSLSAINRLDFVYSIRGIHTGFNPQVLVLVDGLSIQNSFYGGKPILFHFPLSNVDKIEVVRGPGSAIYGADAYAGVINIITKSGIKASGLEVGGGFGSFGIRNTWMNLSKNQYGLDIDYSLSYQRSDGDKSRSIERDLQTTLDEITESSASLAPGPLSTRYEVVNSHLKIRSQRWRFNLLNWISKDSGVGAGAAQTLDPSGQDRGELLRANVEYLLGDDVWNTKINTIFQRYESEAYYNIFPEGSVVPIGEDGNPNFLSPERFVLFENGLIGNPGGVSRDSSIQLTSLYTGAHSHRLRFSFGSKYQKMITWERKNFGPGVLDGDETVVGQGVTDVSYTEFKFLQDSNRRSHNISFQDEWRISDKFELVSGVRSDYYSDFGLTTNPRVAFIWKPQSDAYMKLLYGSAFRAPSFSEQFFRNNPVNLGNPDLNPEKIKTYELAVGVNKTEELRWNLSLFRYNAKGLIEIVADDNMTTSTAQNARNQDGYGAELEFEWDPNKKVRLASHFSWQHSEDSDTRKAIADSPGFLWALDAKFNVARSAILSMQVNYIADRHRAPEDVRAEIDNYAIVNSNLNIPDIWDKFDLSFGVKNLTNEDAREPSNGIVPGDFPLAERAYYLEARYVF